MNRWLDRLISVVVLALVGWAGASLLHWLATGAAWAVVSTNLPLYAVGSYPENERWRPLLWMVLLLLLTLLTLLGPRSGLLRRALPASWMAMVPLGVVLLAGGLGLLPVPSRDWGGLGLTLLLTVGSGVLALPFGVMLALGRQSTLPVLRYASAAYIETMRAVPLIAVLFFGQLLIPLFLPVGLELNRVLRAVIAFAVFAAAYIAEDVRGGLQAIPATQVEAAAVLGLSPRQSMQLVVLPQALRIALPALTNQAVGLLQNTSLLAILGLVELLGISRSLLANPAFIGRYLEVYVWLAGVYWLVCTAMALLARHLELQLDPVRSSR
ncbi:amino acid ABC transporter permease [Synechococcus sp. KORDI-100]|uniref:amino acid ABC transporter permease n=1 Tax=Synechococcus sp. KORDI-100 TaxID=1280380 RepID=UPI0004E06003|nr:amino acid ABC transporter permease [Synechococcus sp. KORDI-100]AII43033.1 amino acid ABC transporter permease [Synechococcus sp. KORDI-100]